MAFLMEAAAIVGLFVVRLGIPLAITILITWWLRSLDRRWQAEAAALRANAAVAAGTLASNTVAAPEAAEQPCWEYRQCSESRRAVCAACRWHDLPCWMARLRTEGQLPAACYGCRYFRPHTPLQQPAS
ncbi:MAG: hypothetical protein H3C34_08045 [Caldilineaceae bacterium]|nr:hypothetical protein [Caldilineaceae bacterium]